MPTSLALVGEFPPSKARGKLLGFGIYFLLPFTVPTIIANIVLFQVGGALAGEAFYKVFSQELFPTMLRGTAQGLHLRHCTHGPRLLEFLRADAGSAGIRPVAALLALFLLISAAVGYLFMPDTSGKSLEQIELERGRA